MAPNYQISAGVMQKLLQGDPFPCDPIVVQLSYDAGKFRISDTSNLWASVTITGVAKEDLQPPPSDFKLYIILIRGYVTSEANANGPQDSILSLTNIDIVSTTNKRNTGGFQKYQLPTASISAGKSYDFWATTAHFLSESDLSGLSLFSEQNKADTISNFMKHNGAIETLKNVSHLPTAAINELYQTTLHDFGNSQRDRQQATLSSNTGRHDAATAATVAHQHSLALEQALDADLAAVLSPALFCSWHGILCNLHRHAGVIRPHHVAVRVGQVAFRPSRQVGNDLDQLSHALNALEIRLRQGLSPSLAAMSFAAAVVFSINDTHAFADGNGRLARLTANWALKRAGIPFCVALFATPAQRKEYVAAQIMTRRNLYLVSRGDVSQESLLTVFRDVGCLSPLVNLFVDRVYKAVTEFNRLVEEKALALSDEDDARAVRVFRESAATGNCLICFEDRPNIATLCCGKACHLNCMAEWLSAQLAQRNTCPQCRSELPSLPDRMRAPPPAAGVQVDVDDYTTTSSVDISTSTTTMSEEEPENHSTTESAADMSTTSVTGTYTTEEEAAAPSDGLPPYCVHGHCNNRSARDCTNSCCGRCCILHGEFTCSRHNS